MKKIAVIEDDVDLGDAIEALLNLEKFIVYRAYSGSEALMLLNSTLVDLVILDLNLPGIKGEEVLLKINKDIPIIVLSAKTSINDKVKNLLNGASDYITKPFSNDELVARIQVQLRKAQNTSKEDLLVFDDITLDVKSMEVKVNDTLVKLTKTEFHILHLLMRNPHQVFSKSRISNSISDYTSDGVESSISVHISSLRHKLSEVSNKDYIQTIWGSGFKLKGK